MKRDHGGFELSETVKHTGDHRDRRPAGSCLLTTYGDWVRWTPGDGQSETLNIQDVPNTASRPSGNTQQKILLASGYLEVNRQKTYRGRDGIGPTRQRIGRILLAWEMER